MSINEMGQKNEEKFDNKRKVHKTPWFLRWTTYFIGFTVAVLIVFAVSEKEIEMKQPSESWSMGVEVLSGLPTDYRLIDQVKLPDNSGIAIAYVIDDGIQLVTFDWYGKTIAKELLDLNTEAIKLIEFTSFEDQLFLYHTDRVSLNRIEINSSTLETIEAYEISKHSEQFAAEGLYVVAGDDTLTEIINNKTVLATYDTYDNIKRVSIATTNKKIIATVNAADGGRILTYADENLTESFLYDPTEQTSYGYIKDIYLENGVLTLVSSVFDHLSPGSPTVLGVWQLEETTYNEISFKLFYHVRTSLDPVITRVDGEKVSYILGTQQTEDAASKGLSRYPQTKGGLFTNVSHFTREGDLLIENTRLTLTRKYPVGYQFFDAPSGNIITWADKVEGKSTIMMAGNTEDYIKYARKQYDINFVELLSAAMMAIGNTSFLGVISLLYSLQPLYFLILGVLIFALVYLKLPFSNRESKGKHILYAMILFTIGCQMYLVVSPTNDLRYFAHIYPWLFGSTVSLVIASTLVSAFSLWIYYLWKRQHYYYTNRIIHFSVFFGVEVYLYLITIMSFFVSALMKNNFKM